MDELEHIRRAEVQKINSQVESSEPEQERARLVAIYGADNVFNTQEMSAKYEVIGFMAPFCVVKDKATGKKGSLEFQHDPRFYFNFMAD
jgi:hypothetical protein